MAGGGGWSEESLVEVVRTDSSSRCSCIVWLVQENSCCQLKISGHCALLYAKDAAIIRLYLIMHILLLFILLFGHCNYREGSPYKDG